MGRGGGGEFFRNFGWFDVQVKKKYSNRNLGFKKKKKVWMIKGSLVGVIPAELGVIALDWKDRLSQAILQLFQFLYLC